MGTPRSLEYRRGMIDVLKSLMCRTAHTIPYQSGTAAFDAYVAGNERGHALWRKLQAEVSQQTGANAEACHV